MNTRNLAIALVAIAIVVAAALLLYTRQTSQDPYANRALPSNLPSTGEPPANLPLEITPLSPETFEPQLTDDGQPQLLLVQDSQPFVGSLRATGEFVLEPNRIQFTPEDGGAALTILYQLPDVLQLGVEGRFQGELNLLEASTPAAANRLLTLTSADSALVLSEAWRTEPEPQRLPVSEGIELVQEAVDPSSSDNSDYTESPVYLEDNGERIADIPIGEASSVETSQGTFNVYVEISHLFASERGDEGEYPPGYILKAWVIGEATG